MIKKAKSKGLIKPHTEAFIKNPVKLESHKGNVNYFKNKEITNRKKKLTKNMK